MPKESKKDKVKGISEAKKGPKDNVIKKEGVSEAKKESISEAKKGPKDNVINKEGSKGNVVLLAQGTYGCIYHPGMSCNHEQLSTKYITKIHSPNERTANNEITISKKIQTIPNYESYFSPVLEDCKVNLAKIEREEAEKCTFVKDVNKTYISTRTRYIEGDTLLKYIEKHDSLTTIYFIYNKLCKSVEKLAKHDIVHFDLRENNMIITKQGQPIIIDFGISIDFSTIKKTLSSLKPIFYAYTTKYKPWCIEIVLISYMVQHNTTNISIEKIMEIFDEVTNHFEKIPYLPLPKYREHFKNHVAPNVSLPQLLETYKRWDTYAVAIILIQMLEKTKQTPSQIYIDKIRENLGFV